MSDRKNIPPEIEAELRAYVEEDGPPQVQRPPLPTPSERKSLLRRIALWGLAAFVGGALAAWGARTGERLFFGDEPPTSTLKAAGTYRELLQPEPLRAEVEALKGWHRAVSAYHYKRVNSCIERRNVWVAIISNWANLTEADQERIREASKDEEALREALVYNRPFDDVLLPEDDFPLLTSNQWPEHYWTVDMENASSKKIEDLRIELPHKSYVKLVVGREEDPTTLADVLKVDVGSLAPGEKARAEVWSRGYSPQLERFVYRHNEGYGPIDFSPAVAEPKLFGWLNWVQLIGNAMLTGGSTVFALMWLISYYIARSRQET